MNTPRDIDIFKYAGLEYTLYMDNPYYLKAYNQYGETENLVGVDIDPGKTNTIAGITSQVTWGGANLALYNNQPASVTPFYGPAGVGADGPNNTIYVSDYSDNCLKKIDGSGIISVFAGVCSTTTGNSGGLFANARFTQPWDIEMDPLYPGNFFVIDASQNTTNSILKYVNTSSTPRSILGIVVNAYSVGNITLSTAMPFSNAVAVSVDQICVASGQFTVGSATSGNNSVFCYSRAGSGTLSLYVGNRNSPDLSTAGWFRGRMQSYMEDEGVGMGWGTNGLDPYNLPVQLSGPQGLTFDDQGNLYISEFYGHTIRMVKRWYP
jgi:hypothetical protein